MLKKYAVYFGLLLFAVIVVAIRVGDTGTYYYPNDPAPTRARVSRTMRRTDGADYVPLFFLNSYSVGNINSFIPSFRPNDLTSAERFAALFNMPEEVYFETQDYFIFWNDYSTLRVYRHSPQIFYESHINGFQGSPYAWNNLAYTREPLSDADRVSIAAAFIEELGLDWEFEEARIHTDGIKYTVTFINRMSNRLLMAFNNTVTMDYIGNILSLNYFFPEFERIHTGRVLTQTQALDHLPPRDGMSTIYLVDGQLVFIYADSIIQPAYFFEGESLDGEPFAYFVKATVY